MRVSVPCWPTRLDVHVQPSWNQISTGLSAALGGSTAFTRSEKPP